MKLNEMKTGFLYEVTRESHDGTFEKGMVIKRIGDDSILLVGSQGGWLDKEEWDQPGVSEYCEVEIWYPKEREEVLKGTSKSSLDIEDAILFYAQCAMCLVELDKDGNRKEPSYLVLKADECWQTAEWLRELISLKQAVHNQFSKDRDGDPPR